MRHAAVVAGLALLLSGCTPAGPTDGVPTIQLAVNGIAGGKMDSSVHWLSEVLPRIESDLQKAGTPVHVRLLQDGATDESYKAKMVLDLYSGTGADVFAFDGFWNAEMASAHLLTMLDPYLSQWPEWQQYLPVPRSMGEYQGHTYVLPFYTDVRGIFYRKDLFRQAGLPEDWHPRDWNDILAAGEQLKARVPGVLPIQWYGGTAYGEATTMQGIYPLLLGAGGNLYDANRQAWVVDGPPLRRMLGFYRTLYLEKGLGNVQLQLDPRGSDRVFEMFRDGKIGIFPESTYLWLGVLAPGGPWGLANRNEVVGWTPMPGGGEPGDPARVSISGGGGFVINPHTAHPDLAWAVLKELASVPSMTVKLKVDPVLPIRKDLLPLQADPELSREVSEALPVSVYRPAVPTYSRISDLAQQMVERCIQGQSIEDDLAQYRRDVTTRVGPDHVTPQAR